MKTTRLMFLGIAIPLLFWVTTIICGLVMGNYSHATRMVSELGAIGTPSQYIFTVGLVLCSLLSMLFIVDLYRACKRAGLSTVPVLILLTFSFSILGAAIFPLPLRLHGILGMPSMLLFLSPILGMILWRADSSKSTMWFSLLALALMLLGFLVEMPDVLSNYVGVKQRFFHAGWSVWFVYLGYRFKDSIYVS
jgi:Predicted membrane protein